MSNINFPDETERRIEFDRLMGNSHKKGDGYIFKAEEFRRYIFMLGLLKYESEILPKQTGKPYYFIQGEEVICRCEPVKEETA